MKPAIPSEEEMMPIKNNMGWTCIELMACVCIITLLISLAVPAWHHYIVHYQIHAVMRDIDQAIRFARNIAFITNRRIQLSPVAHQNWSRGIQLTQEPSTIISIWDWKKYHVQVSWHGFQNNKHLTFMSHLYQAGSNGTFYIRKDYIIKKMVVNRLGHVVSNGA